MDLRPSNLNGCPTCAFAIDWEWLDPAIAGALGIEPTPIGTCAVQGGPAICSTRVEWRCPDYHGVPGLPCGGLLLTAKTQRTEREKERGGHG